MTMITTMIMMAVAATTKSSCHDGKTGSLGFPFLYHQFISAFCAASVMRWRGLFTFTGDIGHLRALHFAR